MLPQTTHITANQRLALHARQQYDKTQQLAGKKVWETLDCLSLKHWILRCYQTLSEATQYVLTDSQALVLWEQIITDATHTQLGLISLSARQLAKTAHAAWRLLKESQVPLSQLLSDDSQEVAAFYQWACVFESYCEEKNYIDFNTCIDLVITAITHKKISLPARIVLTGFEDPTPQIKLLFALLSEQSRLEQCTTTPAKPSVAQKIALDNETLELEAMAQWAYHMHLKNPHQLIGCVVPDLNEKRHLIMRIFDEVFADKAAFNISGGFALAHFPLIGTAFDILNLDVLTPEITLLGRLLNSPFLGGSQQELTARAHLDIQLRKTEELKIEWKKIKEISQKQGDCSIWSAQCDRYLVAHYNESLRQTAHRWGEYFSQQLQCMGWPGERVLNSSEYQQLQRWYQLLQEFNRLDVVLEKPISRAQALQSLHHLAQETVFQSQTTQGASVQVLGLLEAIGLSFAGLWISGMTQQDWPASAAPNPFIPLSLQRKLNMPHASAARELAYSRLLTKHFCEHAETIIFSYAAQKEDTPQLPSSLIVDLLEITDFSFFQPSHLATLTDSLEYIVDDCGPELTTQEAMQGGASLFKYQAACPFQAFARIRLNAAEMPTPESGMTPRERGTCLHAILEKVWRILKNHQTLCEYSEDALRVLLEPIVREVLSMAVKKRSVTLRKKFIALEEQRLIEQITAWLVSEKQRPPFYVVEVESERTMQFAGLTLRLRIDRQDKLEDGSYVLIDYKTGMCHAGDWEGDRPDEPQLPLYGATCEYPLAGLAFARIAADTQTFIGISQKEINIRGVLPKEDWNNFWSESKASLTRLAKEFQMGYAKVDPKNLQQTCERCDLQPFCRIYEK